MSSVTDTHLSSELRILDPQVRGHVDTFRVILLAACSNTIFPELLEVFGLEDVTKFMDIFGGLTIRVPSRTFLKQAIRDVDIYKMMTDSFDKSAAARYLSSKYDIDEAYVRDCFERVKELRQRYGVE